MVPLGDSSEDRVNFGWCRFPVCYLLAETQRLLRASLLDLHQRLARVGRDTAFAQQHLEFWSRIEQNLETERSPALDAELVGCGFEVHVFVGLGVVF